mmetsp:Transcript_41853/g.164092  ORF Transcript_41853/g.164092 Transcript_41853/m.164092 type:complete len:278 (-) Transcript_41853:229-1062(-)|eukprot:CAMPEP_0113957390 /NCGR_PEP_ID=MMETSP0011_2-20120614/2750_1 /TAXON_ID=101924 /ORGANISM="Rhodosorus marinus" /LENGTH=277 /DNA_ID=CAMNT_0000967961 /DNA_START=536 /DNA_END=1369 /DNA_ORIENTATION=- /assembly_acc=CAM_ASM_000156
MICEMDDEMMMEMDDHNPVDYAHEHNGADHFHPAAEHVVEQPVASDIPLPAPVETHSPRPVVVVVNGREYASGQHVTIWNKTEKRKIAGNAAPLGKNLAAYLRKHPDCEVYSNQNVDLSANKKGDFVQPTGLGAHVPIWNRVERRKIAGNAAPLAKNLEAYLARHPDCEPYAGQDKRNPSEKSTKASPSRPAPPPSQPVVIPEDLPPVAHVMPMDPWMVGVEVEVEVEERGDPHMFEVVFEQDGLPAIDFSSSHGFSPTGYLSLGNVPAPGIGSIEG